MEKISNELKNMTIITQRWIDLAKEEIEIVKSL